MSTDIAMTDSFASKMEALKRRLRTLESAVVAFSAGVDSSVLVFLAREVLNDRMVAATAISPSLPASDRGNADKFCRDWAIPHLFVETHELDDPLYAANPEDRCYYCKKHLMSTLVQLADEKGFNYVVEGTNASDLGGHRPGHRASSEMKRVATPLIDAGFTKDDVRRAARELGIPQAEKPAAACLSSRIPTGERITAELLRRIDAAEDALRKVGVGQVRIRHHGQIARIEVSASDMTVCLDRREEIVENIKKLGWRFVTLDLIGYRTGGMRS